MANRSAAEISTRCIANARAAERMVRKASVRERNEASAVLCSSGVGIVAYSQQNAKRKMAGEAAEGRERFLAWLGMMDSQSGTLTIIEIIEFVAGPEFACVPVRRGQYGRGKVAQAAEFWRKGGLGCDTLRKNFSADEDVHCHLSGIV
jgi:hypothetical protein